jgi:hypothetical protein
MRVSEYGLPILLNTGIDLTAYTSLQIDFTRSDQTTFSVNDPDVSVGVADLETAIGTFLANEYVSYTFVAGDLTVAGTWHVQLIYIDAGRRLLSPVVTFRVYR